MSTCLIYLLVLSCHQSKKTHKNHQQQQQQKQHKKNKQKTVNIKCFKTFFLSNS
jgi:hypothetical protein